MNLPDVQPSPCGECPWRRISLPGWLGPFEAGEWVALAHSDEPIACHTTLGVQPDEDSQVVWLDPRIRQCAGAATYRANVAKRPRTLGVITGPVDRVKVFATPAEFKEHHAE